MSNILWVEWSRRSAWRRWCSSTLWSLVVARCPQSPAATDSKHSVYVQAQNSSQWSDHTIHRMHARHEHSLAMKNVLNQWQVRVVHYTPQSSAWRQVYAKLFCYLLLSPQGSFFPLRVLIGLGGDVTQQLLPFSSSCCFSRPLHVTLFCLCSCKKTVFETVLQR